MTTMVSSLVASMPGTTDHEGSSHLRILRMERRTLCTWVAYCGANVEIQHSLLTQSLGVSCR